MKGAYKRVQTLADLTALIEQLVDEEWATIKSTNGQRIATKFKLDLTSRVKLQSFSNWPPLSPLYKQQKAKRGLDPRTLIARMDYLRAIKVQHQKVKGGDDQYTVGLPQQAKHYSGLTYNQLAAVHEYGTKDRRIPARPHWRPTIHKFQGLQPRFEREMQDRIVRRVEARLRAAMSGGTAP